MRALDNFILALNLQSFSTNGITKAMIPGMGAVGTTMTPFTSIFPDNKKRFEEERTMMVQELLEEATKVGQVGSLVSKKNVSNFNP